jgi:hypothetical protein
MESPDAGRKGNLLQDQTHQERRDSESTSPERSTDNLVAATLLSDTQRDKKEYWSNPMRTREFAFDCEREAAKRRERKLVRRLAGEEKGGSDR